MEGQPDEPEENQSAKKDDPREWVARSSAVLRDAAQSHSSWARALEANEHLSRLLADAARYIPASIDLEALMPAETRRTLDLLTKFGGQAQGSDALRAAEAINKIAAFRPALEMPVSKGLVPDASFWLDALPDLKVMQRSLDILNRPSATRETATFLTATDTLRYRSRRRVWHYTSAHALGQILTTGILWASNPHHLNDASELVHGVGIVRDAVERAAAGPDAQSGSVINGLREVTDETFVNDAMHEIYYISASSAPDSLTLWRNYSTTDGFAIGLRADRPLSAEGRVLLEPDADPSSDLPAVAHWYTVHYRDGEKSRLADAFVASAAKDLRSAGPRDHSLAVRELRKHLLVLASTMKHRAFEDEREVRWITTNWAPVDVVHFEITGRGFVPVLHVRSAGATGSEHQLPITGLRCSPTTGPTIERTMRGLLEQREYLTASKDVVRSTLPYRG